MTIKVQIAYFLRENIDRADLFFYKFNETLNNIFDESPVNFPLPPDVPSEVPRLQASSSNKTHKLSIAKNRIDLIIENDDGLDLVILDKFSELNKTFFNALIEAKYKISRIGLVSQNVFDIPSSIKSLEEKYLKFKLGSNLSEFSIRYNDRGNLDEFVINNITDIYTSTDGMYNPATGQNKYENNIIITKDINNAVIFDKNYDEELFVSLINNYYNKLLSKHVKELL